MLLFINQFQNTETLLKITDQIAQEAKTRQQLVDQTRSQGTKHELGTGTTACVKVFQSNAAINLLFENGSEEQVDVVVLLKAKNLTVKEDEMKISLKAASEQFFQFNSVD